MTQVTPDPADDLTPAPAGVDPTAHAALQLENALLRAGVDLDSPQGQLVRDAWAGKEVDADAIKGQWELVKPSAPAPAPVPDPEPRIEGEAGQGRERAGLAATAVVEPNPMDRDPVEVAREAGREALNRGATHIDAAATVIHTLGTALDNGDKRVLVDHSRYANVPNDDNV